MSDYVSKIHYDIPSFVAHCIDRLASLAFENATEYSSISIICKDDICHDLLKYFAMYDEDGYSLDFGRLNYDPDNYEKEYAISIFNDGLLTIDKVYNENGVIQIFREDIVYVYEKANSLIEIVHNAEKCNVIPFGLLHE